MPVTVVSGERHFSELSNHTINNFTRESK